MALEGADYEPGWEGAAAAGDAASEGGAAKQQQSSAGQGAAVPAEQAAQQREEGGATQQAGSVAAVAEVAQAGSAVPTANGTLPVAPEDVAVAINAAAADAAAAAAAADGAAATSTVAAHGEQQQQPQGKHTFTLAGVKLEVAPGELLGICGMTGSGKSCLLGALLGELQPLPGPAGNVEGEGAPRGQSIAQEGVQV